VPPRMVGDTLKSKRLGVNHYHHAGTPEVTLM
jgi:hypothetical protein